MFDYVEKRENEVMSRHTTLHIGGCARWFLFPQSANELEQIYHEARLCGVDIFVIGGGSNLLVLDDGFSGAIVSTSKFNKIEMLDQGFVRVGAGVNLFVLNMFCRQQGLSGIEWSYGIPGTVGGACKMNAGAYGGEFCKHIENIEIFDGKKLKKRTKIQYSYRKGCLRKGEVLLYATIKLEKSSSEKVRQRQEDFLTKRKESQPFGYCSLGSVFKRGKDFLPAKLIDEFGFKGVRRGDVQISEKHAGFFINMGNGTARDFLFLVQKVEEVALSRGYKFEREFIVLGDK